MEAAWQHASKGTSKGAHIHKATELDLRVMPYSFSYQLVPDCWNTKKEVDKTWDLVWDEHVWSRQHGRKFAYAIPQRKPIE